MTDLLLPSDADLDYLCPGQDEASALASLLDAGRAMVLLKKGAQGSVYHDRERRIATPAFPAEEVDPTGAGDCFGGTFVACLAQGVPLERAVRLANAAGALAVGKKGADGGQLDHGRARGLPGSRPMSVLQDIVRRQPGRRAPRHLARSARPIRWSLEAASTMRWRTAGRC